MPEMDDRLQKYISQIEAGVPREKVLASLGEGEQELAALIKLADAMRTLPQPLPAPAYSRALKQKVVNAAAEGLSARKANRNQVGWLFFPSLAGAVTMVLVMFITIATLGIWIAGPASAQVAQIEQINGIVEVANSPTSDNWAILNNGDHLRSGQYLRVSPGSQATLVYFDGSETWVGPETRLALKQIDGSWGGELQVMLEQPFGETTHQVVPLRGETAFFTVQTPSGNAQVRGTAFNVQVTDSGAARIIVESGKVAVQGLASEVIEIPAGFATLVEPGETPAEPGNFFSVTDVVQSVNGSLLTISGQSFAVTNQTTILEQPMPGDALHIEGRILANGAWIADLVEPLDQASISTYIGTIESISDLEWVIGGKTIAINEVTKGLHKAEIGTLVEVEYIAPNADLWVALKINTVESSAKTPEAETTEPTQLAGTPENQPVSCENTEPTAEAVALAEKFQVTAEEIMSRLCMGFGYGEIELAYSLSQTTGISAGEIFTMRANMGWGQIYALLLQNNQMGSTNHNPLAAACSGSAVLPRVERLSAKYGYDYELVLDLYCQGYSLSTIDLALSLSEDLDADLQTILDKVDQGENWGQIKKALVQEKAEKDKLKEPNPNKDNNPSKDKDKDKDNPSDDAPGQQDKPAAASKDE
jgi:hypothetical protein